MATMEQRVLGALLAGAVGALVLTGCGAAFGATETVDDGQPVNERITSVRFDVPAGAVRIRVRQGAPVSFQRHIEYRDEHPGRTHLVERGTLVLSGCGDECDVDYDVVLPAKLPVSGTTQTGGVEIAGATTVDVRTAAGNVTAEDVTGPATARANSGNVTLRTSEPADVTAESASGNVTVDVPRATYRVRTRANAGTTDVTVPTAQDAEHVLDLRTSAGNITAHTS